MTVEEIDAELAAQEFAENHPDGLTPDQVAQKEAQEAEAARVAALSPEELAKE